MSSFCRRYVGWATVLGALEMRHKHYFPTPSKPTLGKGDKEVLPWVGEFPRANLTLIFSCLKLISFLYEYICSLQIFYKQYFTLACSLIKHIMALTNKIKIGLTLNWWQKDSTKIPSEKIISLTYYHQFPVCINNLFYVIFNVSLILTKKENTRTSLVQCRNQLHSCLASK